MWVYYMYIYIYIYVSLSLSLYIYIYVYVLVLLLVLLLWISKFRQENNLDGQTSDLAKSRLTRLYRSATGSACWVGMRIGSGMFADRVFSDVLLFFVCALESFIKLRHNVWSGWVSGSHLRPVLSLRSCTFVGSTPSRSYF